jgi:predicted DNA-binding WGR domain protein
LIRYFEFIGIDTSRGSGRAEKFWEVSLSGAEVRVRFGKIGANGQTNLKTFPDAESASREVEKLVKEKLKKGYQESSRMNESKPQRPDGERIGISGKYCVACSEQILETAKLCKHCGTLQNDPRFLEELPLSPMDVSDYQSNSASSSESVGTSAESMGSATVSETLDIAAISKWFSEFPQTTFRDLVNSRLKNLTKPTSQIENSLDEKITENFLPFDKKPLNRDWPGLHQGRVLKPIYWPITEMNAVLEKAGYYIDTLPDGITCVAGKLFPEGLRQILFANIAMTGADADFGIVAFLPILPLSANPSTSDEYVQIARRLEVAACVSEMENTRATLGWVPELRQFESLTKAHFPKPGVFVMRNQNQLEELGIDRKVPYFGCLAYYISNKTPKTKWVTVFDQIFTILDGANGLLRSGAVLVSGSGVPLGQPTERVQKLPAKKKVVRQFSGDVPEQHHPQRVDSKESSRAIQDLKSRLEKGWGSEIQITSDVFFDFESQAWSALQLFVRKKTNFELGWRNFEEFMHFSSLKDAEGEKTKRYQDTLYSLVRAISSFREALGPAELSRQLAAAGTLAQFPYGGVQSGTRYSDEALENVQVELEIVESLISKVSSEASSFTQYLESEYALTRIGAESIDLLSDFGRSLLVYNLTKEQDDHRILELWVPDSKKISNGMTPVLVAGLAGKWAKQGIKGKFNPRFAYLLLEAESSPEPWWMEMSLWGSAIELWKSKIGFPIEELDLMEILNCTKNFLAAKRPLYGGTLDVFDQDKDLFKDLVSYLERFGSSNP